MGDGHACRKSWEPNDDYPSLSPFRIKDFRVGTYLDAGSGSPLFPTGERDQREGREE